MGLMKKLTSAIVASSLVFSLAGSAFAAYTPAAGETAGNRMMGLQILKGKYENDPLALKDEITRAELVTVIVRAFGKEADAALLNGAAAFPDTASHWASGNIAMAKALVEKAGGDAIGMPDGSFDPNGKLTPAQAVAFLMKFLGVKADASKPWPASFLDKAVELNIITAEDAALIGPMSNDAATRGLVFYMFDRAFYNYDLGAGKTFYTKYVDPTAPVVTLNAVEPTTLDSKVTITGKVEGATEAYVGTKSVTLDANGNFSVDYELPELKEYNIAVTARDLAGNTAEKAVVVTRSTGNAAAIEAAAITVAAGQSVDVATVVKDAKGNALTGVAVSGESTVGTFADGKFTAGKTAGTGTLTLKAGEATANVNVTVTAGPIANVVASDTAVKVGEKVTLSATDEFGNAVTGVSYTNDNADGFLDSAKGVFVASAEGTFTITGSKDGKTATATIGVYSSDVAKLVVTAPASVVGNTSDVDGDAVESDDDIVGSVYEVTVKAVDENGNLVGDFDGAVGLAVPAGFIAAEDDDATFVEGGIVKDAENGVVTFKVLASVDSIGRSYDFEAVTVLSDATIIGNDDDELTAATVEITEQVATSVKISTSGTAKYIRSNGGGDSTSVAVYVADQDGKRFLDTTGYTVNLSVTGAATISAAGDTEEKTIEAVYSGADIEVTFNSIQGKSGDATLTASVEGLGTATASVTAAVAEDAAKFSLEADKTSATAANAEKVTYSIQVTDQKGVPVQGAVTLKATFADVIDEDNIDELTVDDVTDAGTLTDLAMDDTTDLATFGITTNADGYAKFTVKANAYTGDLKLTVKDNDANVSVGSADATVAFKADSAAQFALVRSSQINVPAAAPTATVSVQLYDVAGNKAAVSGKEITFTGSSDVKFNGTAKKATVKTDSTGKATVEVSVLGYVGNVYTITAASEDDYLLNGSDPDDEVLTQTVDIAVKNAVASKLSYTLKDADGASVTRVTAGEEVTLTVTAKDAAGKAVGTDDESDTIKFYPAGDAKDENGAAIKKDTGIQVKWDETANAYVLTFVPETSGTFAFTLKDSTAPTTLEQAGSLRVVADVAAKFVVNGGDDIKVEEGKASGAITLKLADQFGNAVASTGKTTVKIEAVDDQGADVNAGIRTSVSAPDAQTLTIAAGASSTTFYVWNSLKPGTYTVTFSVEGTTISGTVDIVVE